MFFFVILVPLLICHAGARGNCLAELHGSYLALFSNSHALFYEVQPFFIDLLGG